MTRGVILLEERGIVEEYPLNTSSESSKDVLYNVEGEATRYAEIHEDTALIFEVKSIRNGSGNLNESETVLIGVSHDWTHKEAVEL